MKSLKMLAMFYQLLIDQTAETVRVLEEGTPYEQVERARELREFRRGLKQSLRRWKRSNGASTSGDDQ
jgi:hypothetical protein